MNPLFTENNHQSTLDAAFHYAVDLAGLYNLFTLATENVAPNLPSHIKDQLFNRIIDLYIADRYMSSIVHELGGIKDSLSNIAEASDYIASQSVNNHPSPVSVNDYGESLGLTRLDGESLYDFLLRIKQKCDKKKGRDNHE